MEREHTPDPILGEPPEVPEQPPLDLEDHMETEVEPASEAEADDQPSQVEVERQEPRRRGGLIERLFG